MVCAEMAMKDLVHRVFVKLPNTDTEHIEQWCESHFDFRGGKWDCYFADDSPYNFDMYYIFEKHEDAVLFSLTWQ
jgi:hypothetical protein